MWEKNRQGAVDVVTGSQSLTKDSVDALRRTFDECTETGQPRLVLDCSQVPLMDSAGLELLLDVRETCRRRGGHFHLAALNPLCNDILQATGIAGLFEIHRDSVSAAGSFAQ